MLPRVGCKVHQLTFPRKRTYPSTTVIPHKQIRIYLEITISSPAIRWFSSDHVDTKSDVHLCVECLKELRCQIACSQSFLAQTVADGTAVDGCTL
ncbi:hypothetical protein TNCV_2208871 [Trichonephila clavipes]|nr:hypothetical protein TNCV_2208871 [Trichonephila clavipes]